MIFQNYVSMLYIRIDIRHLWQALRNFAMGDFEENVEEMVETLREAPGGDRVRRGRDQGRDRRSRRPQERDRRQDGDDAW